jgi:serine/threonine protein phosphatase 1
MYIVVGDIHGCFDEFLALLEKIGPSENDMIISVGDMVDRGPESPEVVSFFMRNKNTLAILGNHERKHLRFSQGLMLPKNFGKNQQNTIRQFENRQAALDLGYSDALGYFKSLPLYLEFPEAIVVHAGLIYGIPLHEQNERNLTGAGFRPENGRSSDGLFAWCDAYPKDAKPVIFGHLGIGRSPWPLPQRDNLWPIDTSCVSGGCLTAVTLPDLKVYQVKFLKSE